MKRHIVYTYTLFALTTAGCVSSKRVLIFRTISIPAERVASTETQYPDKTLCLVAATAYRKGQGYSDEPIPVGTSQTIYSFKKNNGFKKKSEVRYIFRSSAPLKGKEISYYELSTSGDNSANETYIRKVVDDLFNSGDVVIDEPVYQDEIVNGKITWRVVMHTKDARDNGGSHGKEGNKSMQVTGDFGLIINPPYPP